MAEHGLLGMISLLLLIGMSLRNLVRAPVAYKPWVAALIAWTFLFMAGTAMRLVLPSLLLGLTFALQKYEDSVAGPQETVR